MRLHLTVDRLALVILAMLALLAAASAALGQVPSQNRRGQPVDLELVLLADSTGSIDDTMTFTLNPALLPLDKRAIVVHGMFAPSGTYDASIPVLCGQLHNQG